MMNGIDVSKHNGIIDWNKAARDGIEFAIIRAGYGKTAKQKDPMFEQNYRDAKANGVFVGAYWYSYAMTPDEAKLEAKAFVECIEGKQFEFPVYFDLEEKKQFALGKKAVSDIIRAFLSTLESYGYYVGLYMSRSPLMTYVEEDIRGRYSIWVAEWASKCNYDGTYGMWQRSEKGYVNGINGNVDLDISYVNYPSIIKACGMNGYVKEEDKEDGTSGTGSTDTGTNTNPVSGGVKQPAEDGTVGCIIKIGDKTYVGVLREQPPD